MILTCFLFYKSCNTRSQDARQVVCAKKSALASSLAGISDHTVRRPFRLSVLHAETMVISGAASQSDSSLLSVANLQ